MRWTTTPFGAGAHTLGRVALLLVAALYVAGPLLAVWQAAPTPWWIRVGLLTLGAMATVRPGWAPSLLLLLVPLLPVVPSLIPDVPAGIVHLVVLTQAVPILIRTALTGWTRPGMTVIPAWTTFLVVCAVSVAVELTPGQMRWAAFADVWRDITSQVPSYVFMAQATQEGRALPVLVALVDGLLCAFMVRQTVSRESRPRVLKVAAIGALATAWAGFLQARTGIGLQSAWTTFDPGITRINATYVDPNALAAYYALMGPVVLGLAFAAAGWRRRAWGAGFLVIVLAMVMTAGRTGLLSMGLACLLLVWLALRRQLDAIDPSVAIRRHLRRLAGRGVVLALTVVALLLAAGTVLNIQHAQQTSYLHTWLYTFNVRQPPDAIAKGRLAVWHTVIGMIREAPFTGIGLGNAVQEFDRYRDRLGVASLPANARLSAHNTFLLVTSELGVLGLVAWLLVMLAVAHGIRAPGNLPAGERASWPALGLAAGLAGFTLTMLTGDRILLREDIVLGTTAAALACVGSGRLSRLLRAACWAVVFVALASWPLRIAARSTDVMVLPAPQGVYDPQVGVRGDTYRWSTGYAVLFLPVDSRGVTVPVRNLSSGDQQLRVYVDGRLADARTLAPGVWVDLTYSFAHLARAGRFRRVALEVSPTWQAPGDARILGVVVGEWAITPPAPQP